MAPAARLNAKCRRQRRSASSRRPRVIARPAKASTGSTARSVSVPASSIWMVAWRSARSQSCCAAASWISSVRTIGLPGKRRAARSSVARASANRPWSSCALWIPKYMLAIVESDWIARRKYSTAGAYCRLSRYAIARLLSAGTLSGYRSITSRYIRMAVA